VGEQFRFHNQAQKNSSRVSQFACIDYTSRSKTMRLEKEFYGSAFDAAIKHHCTIFARKVSGFTPPCIIRAALVVVLSRHNF